MKILILTLTLGLLLSGCSLGTNTTQITEENTCTKLFTAEDAENILAGDWRHDEKGGVIGDRYCQSWFVNGIKDVDRRLMFTYEGLTSAENASRSFKYKKERAANRDALNNLGDEAFFEIINNTNDASRVNYGLQIRKGRYILEVFMINLDSNKKIDADNREGMIEIGSKILERILNLQNK